MDCLQSPFGGAACLNRPTPYSGKQSAARIRNSIVQSNRGVGSLSPTRFVHSYSSAMYLTLKSWPNQDGIRSRRRRTGGQLSSVAATDLLSMLYLPRVVNESGPLRSMECAERTFDGFVPTSCTP